MIKVLVVVPYEEMSENFKRAIEGMAQEGVSFTLAHFYGTNSEYIASAGKYDIVVARGMTYQAIRLAYPDLHVIELKTSANGILLAIKDAVSWYGSNSKFGIVIPDTSVLDEEALCSLTGLDIKMRSASNDEEMTEVAGDLISVGCEVLIGGGFLRAYSELHGTCFVGIIIDEESIHRAISEALTSAEILRRERLKLDLNKTIINALPLCVLTVDRDMLVLSSNTAADTFFGLALSGVNISSFFPAGLIEKTLVNGLEIESVQTILSEEVLVSQRPVRSAGGLAAFISLQKIPKSMNEGKQDRHGGMTAQYHFSDIISKDIGMRQVLGQAARYAESDSSVLITGETGTGKELLVQSIHNASSRKQKPFVAINCASLGLDLLESELFGYESGAFTGASKNGRIGLFELADGGTVFLDEIGELPNQLQAKLLRVLQEKVLRRVGGSELIPVDVRIISATNQDLNSLVREGKFRSDLYYRINVLTVDVPPLRSRGMDVFVLFQHFLEMLAFKMKIATPTIGEDAIGILLSHSWPGNVRELRNFAEKIITLNGSRHIDARVIRNTGLQVKKEGPKANLGTYKKSDRDLYESYVSSGLTLSEFASVVGVSRTTLWRKFRDFTQSM